MTILLELDQFSKPDIGKNKLVTALQNARAVNKSSHPVFDWLKSADIHSPVLAFDMTAIEARMQWLSEISRQFSVTPLFAVKSCTDSRILGLANQYLSGFDVSNLAEYSLLPDDLRGGLVSVTSPSLTDCQDNFLNKGNELLVTLDSQSQLDRHLSQENPCDYVLRIQGPELLQEVRPADSAYYPVTRFGFSLAEVNSLLTAPWMKNTLPVGFHVHHGSEVNQLSTYRTMACELKKLVDILGRPVKYINLGGGWHGLERQEICNAMEGMRRLFPETCSILFEPGRWFVENTGYAVGTIVNIAKSGNIVKCTLNLSGKSHLHWSTPRLLHLTDPGFRECNVVQFFGPSCYESDFIGKYYLPYATDIIRDAGLDSGKQVVFSNVSTYSVEWNCSFNGIPRAVVEWINL